MQTAKHRAEARPQGLAERIYRQLKDEILNLATAGRAHQQAIPAVEYLLSADGGSAKRFFLLGTDYVYPTHHRQDPARLPV